MARLMVFQLLAIVAILSVISINGQISTPCTLSKISSFTPCLNFVTGSTSGNAPSPTSACCSSLRLLVSTSMDCACLVLTANVPFQIPINITLALSLTRVCKTGGVPVQCKGSRSPLPAPGPALLGPTLPPTEASPFSPRASKASALASALQSETSLPFTLAFPPVVEPEGSTVLQKPSASSLSYNSPPLTLLLFIGIMIFKCY